MQIYDLIIVGGGWAGLAAATKAVQSGMKVALYERGRELGGRASSFFDKRFGEWLDNGPHIFIGAYKTALDMLKTWNAEDGIDFDIGREITWRYLGGKIVKMKMGSDGGKLASAAGLMTFRGMSMMDRLRTARAVEALMNTKDLDPKREPTVAQFLARYGIKPGSCGRLWDALTIAVMNAPVDIAGAWNLVRAIKEGLMIGGSAARIGLMRKPLKRLFCDPAQNYLESKSVPIYTSKTVSAVEINRNGRATGIVVDGKKVITSAVILSVPPLDVLRMLPSRWCKDSFFLRFKQFEYAPIATVHISFDRPVMDTPYVHFPGGFTHWLFSRSDTPVSFFDQSRISTIISYYPIKNELSSKEIFIKSLNELHDRFPESRNANVKEMRVVQSKRATVLLKPGSDSLRPTTETPVKGLYLAGDWCATGLPATIEGAARSGVQVVEYIRSNK